MFTYIQLLIVAAVVPGIILMVKVYQLDTIEHEPVNMLAKLALFGVLSTFIALVAELLLSALLGAVVTSGTLAYNIIDNFIVVACVEEGCKYFFLKKYTWRSPEFNYRFDAVVYAVMVGLGFAIFENVEYAFSYGLANTLLRAVTAIPGHCIFAIFMGHYYGRAKQCYDSGNTEGCRRFLTAAYLIPVLLHGIYDFTAGSQSVIGVLVFFVFVIALDIVAFRKLKEYAAEDEPA